MFKPEYGVGVGGQRQVLDIGVNITIHMSEVLKMDERQQRAATLEMRRETNPSPLMTGRLTGVPRKDVSTP